MVKNIWSRSKCTKADQNIFEVNDGLGIGLGEYVYELLIMEYIFSEMQYNIKGNTYVILTSK